MKRINYSDDVATASVEEIESWAVRLGYATEADLGAVTARYMRESKRLEALDGKPSLKADEQRERDAIARDVKTLAGVAGRLEETINERREAIREARRQIPPLQGTPPENWATPRGGLRTEGTYRSDVPEVSFFVDIVNSRHDPIAQERLLRNQKEALALRAEYRDLDSSDPGAAGYIPPLWVGEAAAELARPARPFANAVPSRPLPDGGIVMSIPKVQSGVTVVSQSAENAAVSETDIDTQSVSASMVTIAGQNDISLQALDRSFPGMDEVIFGDLQAAYDSELDRQLLEGAGSGSAEHLGISGVTGRNTVTYTAATPSGAGLLPRVYEAIAAVSTNRYRQPDVIVMHGRRGAWLSKETLASAAPLFQQGALYGAFGQQDGGSLQTFAGLQVIHDQNISVTNGGGTNEESGIYVLHSPDLRLYEGAPVVRRLDDVLSGTLTVRLQLYAFSFFVGDRQPKAVSHLSGSGLATPVW